MKLLKGWREIVTTMWIIAMLYKCLRSSWKKLAFGGRHWRPASLELRNAFKSIEVVGSQDLERGGRRYQILTRFLFFSLPCETSVDPNRDSIEQQRENGQRKEETQQTQKLTLCTSSSSICGLYTYRRTGESQSLWSICLVL